jgi:hypothetical protein
MLLVEQAENATIVRIGNPQMSLIKWAVEYTLECRPDIKPYIADGLDQLLVQMEKIHMLKQA